MKFLFLLLLLISTVMSLKIGVSRPSTTKMATADSSLAVFNRRNALSSIGSAAVFNRRNALSSIGSAGAAVLLSPQLAFGVDDDTADMVARM